MSDFWDGVGLLAIGAIVILAFSYGLFAVIEISAGDRICETVGTVIESDTIILIQECMDGSVRRVIPHEIN